MKSIAQSSHLEPHMDYVNHVNKYGNTDFGNTLKAARNLERGRYGSALPFCEMRKDFVDESNSG